MSERAAATTVAPGHGHSPQFLAPRGWAALLTAPEAHTAAAVPAAPDDDVTDRAAHARAGTLSPQDAVTAVRSTLNIANFGMFVYSCRVMQLRRKPSFSFSSKNI